MTIEVQPTHRSRGHVVSLVVGIPTTLVMLWVAAGHFVNGPQPFVFAAMSATGSVLAAVGLRSQSRRFRWPALLLTLIPGSVVAIYAAAMVALVILLGGGNPNS